MGQIGDRGLANGTKSRKQRKENRPPREASLAQGGLPESGPRGDRPGGDPSRRRPSEIAGDRGERPRASIAAVSEGPPEIELEKLIGDSLYLDNQAHAIVSRMRDMDSGTKSQLRRLYGAVRRAVRAPGEASGSTSS